MDLTVTIFSEGIISGDEENDGNLSGGHDEKEHPAV